MAFSKIVQESKVINADDFLKTAEKVTEILDRKKPVNQNITVTGKLVKLKPVGEALVIGDLHGDLKSLNTIMGKSGFFETMKADRSAALVFLGDYGDRGVQSPELCYSVLSLKLAFPEQVILLRGNHEAPSDMMAYPHDLPFQLQRKFKQKGGAVYQQLQELFSHLYNAVYVENRYLMVHGGLPTKLESLQELADADQLHPHKAFLEELLWNDPDEQVKGVVSSPRGAGYLFGKTVTAKILQTVNAKILIRGHESTRNGFKINHNGKILTLFSRKGPPYFNRNGAYLELSLKQKFENANQLVPFIHTF
ncbi:MAG: serine/threonine protein phosphatase [Candidatus Bathyarchaeota archaeon]|nr:serine/threonine protein phosphatase [Candidatus Bathyarchaeota archaeon]